MNTLTRFTILQGMPVSEETYGDYADKSLPPPDIQTTNTNTAMYNYQKT